MRDGTTTRARRSTRTVYNYYLQALIQFYLPGHGATTFIQINKEKATLKDKGVRLDLLGLYGVGLVTSNLLQIHKALIVSFNLRYYTIWLLILENLTFGGPNFRPPALTMKVKADRH